MLIIEATMKYIIIGHSLGASVSLALEKKYKKEVKNLILMG